MNTLSWLIYAADFVPKFGVFSVVLGIVSVLFTLVGAAKYTEGYSQAEKQGKRILKCSIPAAFLCFVVAIFIPSRETIMLIATTEMGEKLVTTDTASKAHRALNKWLDDYLLKGD